MQTLCSCVRACVRARWMRASDGASGNTACAARKIVFVLKKIAKRDIAPRRDGASRDRRSSRACDLVDDARAHRGMSHAGAMTRAHVRAAGTSTSGAVLARMSSARRVWTPRARSDARTRVRANALPPANEVAGFVVGGALLALCLAGTRLDAFIARAQARGFEEEGEGSGARTRAVNEKKPTRGSGNIFVLPDDDENGGAS